MSTTPTSPPTDAPTGRPSDLPVPASADPAPGSPVPVTMRAWTQDRYGVDALVETEVDTPTPGEGEVLVEVAATSMNAADRYLVECPALAMRPMFGLRRPRRRIPGLDLAGTVVAVGAGVTRFAPGDGVIGEGSGAWARYACAAERHLAHAPTSIDLVDAAALPVAGLTALQGLRDRGGAAAGSSVLVYGATGGVGTLAVQIAVALGAEVTAVCGAASSDLVRSLGATEVVDRAPTHAGDPAERLAAAGRRFDVVFDVAGVESTRRRAALLAPDGVCVIVGAPSGGPVLGPIRPLVSTMIAGRFVRGRFTSFTAAADADDLAELSHLVDDGSLRPVIDDRIGVEQLPDALRRFTSGPKRGKLVVSMSTD